MRTEYKNTNLLGEKHSTQITATRQAGIEAWIASGVVVVGVTVLIWLLSRL